MMPENTFSSQIFSATNTPFDLCLQYGTLRYNCFQPDDPYLKLNHTNKVEFDEFDELESTLYVMAWTEGPKGTKRELMGATRLIPTLLDYDLEAPSWDYITGGIDLPKSEAILESSRGVSVANPRNEHQACMGLLGVELHELCQRLGVEKLLSVSTSGFLDYMRAIGVSITSMSPPVSTDRDDETLELYTQDVDAVFRDNSYQKYIEALSNQRRVQLPTQAANEEVGELATVRS